VVVAFRKRVGREHHLTLANSKNFSRDNLTAGRGALGFQYRNTHAIVVSASGAWFRPGSRRVTCLKRSSPTTNFLVLPGGAAQWAGACRLDILDKGKPAARPGRKAVGQSDSSAWKPGCRRDECGRRFFHFGGRRSLRTVDLQRSRRARSADRSPWLPGCKVTNAT